MTEMTGDIKNFVIIVTIIISLMLYGTEWSAIKKQYTQKNQWKWDKNVEGTCIVARKGRIRNIFPWYKKKRVWCCEHVLRRLINVWVD